MRRAAAVPLVLLLALAFHAPSYAGHGGGLCIDGALSGGVEDGGDILATSGMGPNCAIVLSCPATAIHCFWNVSAEVSGIGEVRGQIVHSTLGNEIASCGSALLGCVASNSFNLPPTGVAELTCRGRGGESGPAALPDLRCTATPTGHSA